MDYLAVQLKMPITVVGRFEWQGRMANCHLGEWPHNMRL
jgi:hypothetical protein